MTKYTHLGLGDEQRFLAGYYVPAREVRLKYGGREVLYVVGEAVIESSCCSAADFAYVIVPGYIVKWQTEKNQDGLPVSEVEPISDEAARCEIRDAITDAEGITHIEFW